MISRQTVRKTAAALIAVLIALMQIVVLFPDEAEAGGDDLSIRIQYAAEPGAKIREKAVISRAQLSGISSQHCYSNVTNVGTVMVMKARGAKVTDILDAAGIDVSSVKLITFRTDDGYTRNISNNQITGYGYYYPKLNLSEKVEEPDEDPTDPTKPSEDPTKPTSDPTEPSEDPTKPTSDPTEPSEDPTKPTSDPTKPSEDPTQPAGSGAGYSITDLFLEEAFAGVRYVDYYERTDSGRIIPRKGFDKGAVKVPAILALEFGTTKVQGKSAESLSMSSKRSYRFCIGQTKLTAGKTTTGSDVTSMDTAYYIYGIDVTLEGYPVKGVRLSVDDMNMKIGSKVAVRAVIDGDSLFSEYVDVNSLVWSSSDTSIATVDQNGVVTIKKDGEVTITATAKGGITGSIVLGGKQGKAAAKGDGTIRKQTGAQTDKTKDKEKNKDKEIVKTPGKLLVREVHIGKEVTNESIQEAASQSVSSSQDTQALDEVDTYSSKTAAGAAAGALCLCGGGVAFRIRKFMKEV